MSCEHDEAQDIKQAKKRLFINSLVVLLLLASLFIVAPIAL